MAPSILKKRKFDETAPIKKSKVFRKQKRYSSPGSSSPSNDEGDEFTAINLADSDNDADIASNDSHTSLSQQQTNNASPSPPTSDFSPSDSEASLTPSNTTSASKRKSQSKRNDPTAFASSITAILSSKLTTQKRPDPVLSRSTTAIEASASIANDKLEAKAKLKLRNDKKQALEKGRVKDVLEPQVDEGVSAADIQEEEKKLRKTAQRGVVKLFNAVRAAQVRAEEARGKGGSRGQKEERVGEMSKKGFLEMVAAGGKTGGKAGGKRGGAEKMEGKEIEEA